MELRKMGVIRGRNLISEHRGAAGAPLFGGVIIKEKSYVLDVVTENLYDRETYLT